MAPKPHERIPGPYAGQKRSCGHDTCITLLHQWHEGRYCHAHEHLYDKETGERLPVRLSLVPDELRLEHPFVTDGEALVRLEAA